MAKNGNWFWAVPTKRAREALELFLKLAVVRGQSYGDVLTEVLEAYNKRFAESHNLRGTRFVEEAELLQELEGQSTGRSRRTLWKLRKNGQLVDGDRPLFYAHGHKVVYDLARCKRFFRRAPSEA